MENLSAERADAGKLLRFDQSGALLRKVTPIAAIGMAIVGIDGRIVYANRAYEVMLGCDPDAVLGQSNVDLFYAEDRKLINLHLGQPTRGEVEDFQTECRMIHHDGGTLWVLMTATLLRSETTSRPLHVVVQIVNIDRQKRAEDALAPQREPVELCTEIRQGRGSGTATSPPTAWSIPTSGGKCQASPRTKSSIRPRAHGWPAFTPTMSSVCSPPRASRATAPTASIPSNIASDIARTLHLDPEPGQAGRLGPRGTAALVGTDTDITQLKDVQGPWSPRKRNGSAVTLEFDRRRRDLHRRPKALIFMNPVAEGWPLGRARVLARLCLKSLTPA